MIDDRFEEEDYESIAHMANVGMILIRSELGGSLLPPSAVSALQSLETDLSNGLMSATTAALSIAKDTSKTSIKRGLRSLWLSSTAILSQTSHVQVFYFHMSCVFALFCFSFAGDLPVVCDCSFLSV